MLIHQDLLDDHPEKGAVFAESVPKTAGKISPQPLTAEEREILWDRIVRIHYLAADLAQPGLAPHVTDEMTRFVAGVLKEWAAQAEEGLTGSIRR